MSAVTTGGSADFTIPATGLPGTHVMEVVHGEFTFPYRNTQQNPEPDRPRWAFSFTVTPGAPVLPPAPEQQAQSVVRALPPQGELVSTPAFSAVGEADQCSGEGFEPGKTYALNWTRVTRQPHDRSGWEESSKAVAEAQADEFGPREFRFETPDDLGWRARPLGRCRRWREEDSARSGSKRPRCRSMSPAGLSARRSRSISKASAGPRPPTSTTWSTTTAISAMPARFNSQGDVEIFLKATGEPGWHFIDLYPGIYKGTERRPNNFRIPQLTYADDHPGEDLPAFHFAFEVTAEGRGPLGQ